jgi:hypothetical protein
VRKIKENCVNLPAFPNGIHSRLSCFESGGFCLGVAFRYLAGKANPLRIGRSKPPY